MTIFINIKSADITQVNDKMRISAKDTFAAKGSAAITLIEIRPSADDSFIDVTGTESDDWFLDWEYTTEGDKVITVRVTTDGAPVTKEKTISVLTAAEDKLFSTDQQLKSIELDILKYLPTGRNSWKNVHRLAQSEILEWLYTHGYYKTDGSRLTKDEVIDIDEVSYWSRYIVLRYIYRSLSNSIDDIFDRKSKLYQDYEHQWRHKSSLKLDYNGDGKLDEGEKRNLTTIGLSRRWD